jgi:hypothetical protein
MTDRNENADPQHVQDAPGQRMPGLSPVVVRESAKGFTAHCVEFDIVGEGDTAQQAMDSAFGLLQEYARSAFELDELERLAPPGAPQREAMAFNAHATMRLIRRRFASAPSTADVEGILPRFGARKIRDARDASWERPSPGGGTTITPVPRDRKELTRQTVASIIRLSGISEDDWWRAVEDPSWPPPVRRCRDALGLTNAEMAPMLDIPETSLELMCSGQTTPGRIASAALAELQRLCIGVASWHAPRGRVWKLMRDPHPACDGARPADALQERRDLDELRTLIDRLIERDPARETEDDAQQVA